MDFAFIYIIQRFFYRLADFFHHWYVDGIRFMARAFMALLASLDKSFAVKITLRHFFDPLYKDYSIVGRILGIIFRSIRAAIGIAVYAVLAVIFIFLCAVWIAIPAVLIFLTIKG